MYPQPQVPPNVAAQQVPGGDPAQFTPAGPAISAPPYPVAPGYPAPPREPGRQAFLVLTIVAAALVVAVGTTLVVGLPTVSRLRHDVASRQVQRDADAQRSAADAAKQRDDFRAANLAVQLQHAKDLDKAVDSALVGWFNGTALFGVLDTAINDCDDAVKAYDRAAAPFPAEMFGALPRRINLSNPETDCGRARADDI
jgi:hypothetical protein